MKMQLLVLTLAALASGAAVADSSSQAPFVQGQTIQVGHQIEGGATVVYDSFTGGTFTTTTGVPRAYEGGAANLSASGPQVDITAVTVYMASTAAGTYNNVRARIQLWNTYTEGATPVYSNPAGALINADLGPLTTTANTFTVIPITLTTPIRLNTLTNKGFAVNFQVDTGAGLADSLDVTGLLATTTAPTVGTSAVNGGNGFYRNASARTDFNFVPTDLRTFTSATNARLAIILTGQSTTPVSLQSFDVE